MIARDLFFEGTGEITISMCLSRAMRHMEKEEAKEKVIGREVVNLQRIARGGRGHAVELTWAKVAGQAKVTKSMSDTARLTRQAFE